MHEHLEQVIGVTSHGMRNRLKENGFTDLDVLVTMDRERVEQTCSTIRKSTTGPAATREVTVAIQSRLVKLVAHAKCMHITQRALDYNAAPLVQLDSVATWIDQLDGDPDEGTVPAYRDNLNKRV